MPGQINNKIYRLHAVPAYSKAALEQQRAVLEWCPGPVLLCPMRYFPCSRMLVRAPYNLDNCEDTIESLGKHLSGSFSELVLVMTTFGSVSRPQFHKAQRIATVSEARLLTVGVKDVAFANPSASTSIIDKYLSRATSYSTSSNGTAGNEASASSSSARALAALAR